MGNSLASQPQELSKIQTLTNQYQLFTVPAQLQNPTYPPPSSSKKSNTVFGKKHLKAQLHLSDHFADPLECQKQLDHYFTRHQSRQAQLFPIVKVLALKQMSLHNVCSSHHWFCVLTEHLHLLDEIENTLSYEECLFLLFECLMGFYYLSVRYGLNFQITDRMIGVNNQGKVKLWINENFALNRSEHSSMEVYVTKSFSSPSPSTEHTSSHTLQVKLIKQLFTIIDQKFRHSEKEKSFSTTLQENLTKTLKPCSVQEMNFQQLLRTLCEYQQKMGNVLFIPNKISLEKSFQSKLPQRQSLSLKLHNAINSYRQERAFQEQKQLTDQSSSKAYSTGMDGNTFKNYVPREFDKTILSTIKKPQVKFHYSSDFGLQSGLLQSGYLLNQNLSHFNFSQFRRDYSVRDAESELIGIRRSQYVERLDDFTNTRSKNDYVNFSYLRGEYQQEIESLSKDLRDTYFRSTGGSQVDHNNLLKNNSFGEIRNPSDSINRSSSELQLVSSKFVQDLTTVRHLTPSTHIDWKGPHSSYKQKIIAPYLSADPTNNFMRITEELEQDSYRPSLMSVNLDQRSSLDRKAAQLKANLGSSLAQTSQLKQIENQPSDNSEHNIIAPIIESRFTQNIRSSPDYIEKPFSLTYQNAPKLSLDQCDKSNLQTGSSFY